MQYDEELGLVSSVMFSPKDLTHLAVTGYFEVDIIDTRYMNAVRYDLQINSMSAITNFSIESIN